MIKIKESESSCESNFLERHRLYRDVHKKLLEKREKLRDIPDNERKRVLIEVIKAIKYLVSYLEKEEVKLPKSFFRQIDLLLSQPFKYIRFITKENNGKSRVKITGEYHSGLHLIYINIKDEEAFSEIRLPALLHEIIHFVTSSFLREFEESRIVERIGFYKTTYDVIKPGAFGALNEGMTEILVIHSLKHSEQPIVYKVAGETGYEYEIYLVYNLVYLISKKLEIDEKSAFRWLLNKYFSGFEEEDLWLLENILGDNLFNRLAYAKTEEVRELVRLIEQQIMEI